MKKTITLMLVSAALAPGAGCSPLSVAKRAVKEMRGASSDAEPVPGTSMGNFARFNSVQIAPPQTELGGLVSAGFKNTLMSELRRRLTQGEDAPFRGGGSPTLTIEPKINWYHKSGFIGPDKYAVVLFYLKADGAEVGRVQITTKSEAARTGDDDLAESMAKELASYFEKHGKKKRD